MRRRTRVRGAYPIERDREHQLGILRFLDMATTPSPGSAPTASAINQARGRIPVSSCPMG